MKLVTQLMMLWQYSLCVKMIESLLLQRPGSLYVEQDLATTTCVVHYTGLLLRYWQFEVCWLSGEYLVHHSMTTSFSPFNFPCLIICSKLGGTTPVVTWLEVQLVAFFAMLSMVDLLVSSWIASNIKPVRGQLLHQKVVSGILLNRLVLCCKARYLMLQ